MDTNQSLNEQIEQIVVLAKLIQLGLTKIELDYGLNNVISENIKELILQIISLKK